MLYLVSTPIGNLSDITFRAVEVLKDCDLILAEDTRHSKKLLSHYEIETKMLSYHAFNEAKREEKLIADLKNGLNIALISDAGTPAIADPGERLVKRALDEGLEVTAIPGPSAILAALVQSGLPTAPFQFIGFLPRKSGELNRALESCINYPGTTLCYESPKRLVKVLSLIEKIAPEQPLVIFRELTKKFEERIEGCAKTLLDQFQKAPPKGEIVLIFGERDAEAILKEEYLPRLNYWMEERNLPKKEALKMVAKEAKRPKREIYKFFHEESSS